MGALVSALNNAILQGNLAVSSCVLRTLIECVNANCVSAESLHGVLVSILNSSLTSGFGSGEFGLYLTLSSLISLSPKLASDPNFADLIQSAIEGGSLFVTPEYIARRELLSPVPGTPDRLETLVICLQSLRSTEWDSAVLIRPYLMDEAIATTLASSEDAHPMGSILTAFKPFVPPVFVQTGPGMGSLSEQWILEELMFNTISLFDKSVGECTKALLRIPVVHDQFEHVLVDVLISASLNISSVPRAFYHSVLHRATVLQESIKPVIPVALHGVPTEGCVDTEWLLADLISFLVGNNMPMPADLSQSILQKIASISIRTQFANSLQPKISSIPIEDPPMGAPFVEDTEAYRSMKEIVRIKDGSELEVLGALKSSVSSYPLFLHALLENGSRTITHLTRLLELYGSIVTNAHTHGFVASKSEGQEMLANTTFLFWKNNEFRLEKNIEIFLKNKMISSVNVADRIELSGEQKLVSYNLVRILMEYLISRKKDLEKELEERIGTDMYDTVSHELGLADSELETVRETLIQKADSNYLKWIQKTF